MCAICASHFLFYTFISKIQSSLPAGYPRHAAASAMVLFASGRGGKQALQSLLASRLSLPDLSHMRFEHIHGASGALRAPGGLPPGCHVSSSRLPPLAAAACLPKLPACAILGMAFSLT